MSTFLLRRWGRKQLSASAPGSNAGRLVFGAAAIGFGLVTLAWPEYKDLEQLRAVLNAADGPLAVYVVAAAQILGGLAMQFRRSAKTGALVLAALYLVFAVLAVPAILAAPRTYNNWGNFFEQFSLLTGAAIVYARFSTRWTTESIARAGSILVAICAVSFALEQAFYLDNTAVLVPKWLPPSRVFWAEATTVAFALAAVALLSNRMALLAARLLTMMLVLFGLIVWVPLLFSSPHNRGNWSETVETFAIAGVTWILADLLDEYRLARRR